MGEYTRHITGENGQGLSLDLLVRPDTDLDSTFRAWCLDGEEWLAVNGWLFSFEDVTP